MEQRYPRQNKAGSGKKGGGLERNPLTHKPGTLGQDKLFTTCSQLDANNSFNSNPN
ncbi:MAG: hypothetical protein OHK005_20280 [Candidatus Methylacidiphilales bacterium]